MMKLGTYAAVSTISAAAAIYYAFYTREQFFPAMVYLSTSKFNQLLLLNMAFVATYCLWQLVKRIFLGTLREAEVERLNEQLWRELMEVLFAMTIFREEFNVTFVAMVTVLLFVKAFHWLAQKRVEYIEITPAVSRVSHLRISTFMVFLLLMDSFFVHSSVSYLLKTRRPSVSLFFAFEYVILATSVVSMFIKYTLYMGDMWMEGQWDNKAVYIFYLELFRDLLHLSLYLFFFLVIFIHYGLPLHLVRELYEIIRNFKARVTDFIRYRKVTSNMNERFPDATAEELGRSDATCIICREEMTVAKKLPCGHLFHVHCLRSWLERQQTCPTCRSPVIPPEGGASESVVQRHQPQGQGQVQAEGQPDGSAEANQPAMMNAQQARLQAAAAAASQYASSFVYPASNAGALNWCPMYVPLVPRQSAPETHEAASSAEPVTASNIGPGAAPGGQVFFMPVIPGSCWPTPSTSNESPQPSAMQHKYLENTIQLLKQQLDAALELQQRMSQQQEQEQDQQTEEREESASQTVIRRRTGKAPAEKEAEEAEASTSAADE